MDLIMRQSNMADMKYIPTIRFPEFMNDGVWEVKRLGEIISVTNPSKKVQSCDYRKKGLYPTIDQSQNYICGYTDDNEGLLNENKDFLIVFGDHTCVLKSVDFPFVQGADGIKIFRSRMIDCLDTKYIYQFLLSRPIVANEYKRHFSELKEIEIIFPHSLTEQQKIAAFLTSLDEQISAHTKKLEALKAHKKGLMQQLFPANGEKTPKLRFPEFKNVGEWGNTTLGQITNVINRRNKSKRDLPIYSISNKNGFILQNEQFDGLDSNKRGYDISMYKIVGKNTFAYNPARINVGSIGYSGNLSEIQISSLYVCFKTTEDVDDSFLLCFFDSFKFSNAVESNVEGGIRSYLFYENFSKIRIDIPSLSEQKKIASCFNTINEIIKTTSEKLNALEQQKKGLMQQLFPICFK
ncbi:MAG: restriction endonuclease subunit S [Bacteroidales bacterium]|nr:restriction endonuclease subunit S [Bacteroidales bacterium]